MQTNLKELDPAMFEFNCIQAQKISETEHCVQHVNVQMWRGQFLGYSVSDWRDGSTIASFSNGVELG